MMLATMLFNGAVPVLESVAAIAADVVPVRVLGNASDAVNEATGAEPAEIEIELLVTAVNPPATADSVYVPVALNTRLLNVATPFTAFAVNVPPTPAGPELIVTCAVDPANGFPLASCNCTTTALSAVPVVPVAGGWVVNANCGT